MKPYDHKKIEKKWQAYWEKKKLYKAEDFSDKPKFYPLLEFPFPSGDGLHVGHMRPYIGMDVVSRKRRMEGANVLFPMGWDAFGLPTENYAIKTGLQPKVVTKKNADRFRKQMKAVGPSFDWSREINTSDPAYYKWTQWIFLKMFEKGLAYKKKQLINWCPVCKIGLANEEVVDGKCERCGNGPVEKKEKEQWMLGITKYADRLDKDLDGVDYLPKIKIQQRNWIGRSEGAEFEFKIVKGVRLSQRLPESDSLRVFTTRADTLFGVTYVVLAPEHELVQKLKTEIKNWPEVEKYILEARKKDETERTAENKSKTGVELKGIKAINPANSEEVPVWIADYVLAQYGTGAVMAVPAHDERDWIFAKKYNLPIKEVIIPIEGEPHESAEFRKTISSVVYRKSDGKFLALKWKKFNWWAVPIGGIEDGESPEKAAEREVFEETGYKVKTIALLGGHIESHFFAENKNVWRARFDQPVLLEVINEKPEEVDFEEKEKHEVLWLTADELLKKITHKYNKVGLERYLRKNYAYIEEGKTINSDKFDNISSEEAKTKITEKFGKSVTTYKLRDWVFSRQRYWGEPIPMIWCPSCDKWIPVPEKDLPVKLPEVKNYQPTDTGESPLASISKWVNVKCPVCKGTARRETDTMPNWAGSSWYYLRYADPKNKKAFADFKKLEYWTPIDWYNGGMEHVTLHVLYSRFWHKFLFDLGLVPTSEPYAKRTSHGMILADGGEKMSKSKGNVVNPDSIIENYGADTLRLYEMFMGPFDQSVVWSTDGIVGPRRFLERVWKLKEKIGGEAENITSSLQKTIKKVSEDIESMSFNTAVSALMIFVNECEKLPSISKETYETFLKLLSPFAPHITEELWSALGRGKSIHLEPWPVFDSTKITAESATIAVQVNGKIRAQFKVISGISDVQIGNMAKALPEVKKWIEGKTIQKVIVVKNRLVSIVVS